MRTTIRLDDGLLADAKAFAARNRLTLTALIDAALREKLVRSDAPEQGPPPELPVFRGGRGLVPGVDLDDNAAVRDRLDEATPVDARR